MKQNTVFAEQFYPVSDLQVTSGFFAYVNTIAQKKNIEKQSYPSFGAGGDVLTWTYGWKRHLVLYRLINDEFHHWWSKPFPHNLSFRCQKAITQEGKVVLQEGQLTQVYSQNLQHITTMRGNYGMLLAVARSDKVFYEKWVPKDGWVVHVYSLVSHERLLTLKPPGPRSWDGYLSVAADEMTGRVAVTDQNRTSLDVFTSAGE